MNGLQIMRSQGTTSLVLFSGGQDSATCLAWALNRFDRVETVGFEYGQRHDVEMTCRLSVLETLRRDFPHWQEKLGADHVLDLSVLGQVSETALTSEAEIKMSDSGLPNTFVPGRNILFFSLASALAYRRDVNDLVAGVCQTDYSGYPDCRDVTIQSMQQTLRLGLERDYILHCPLMWIDKKATWELAFAEGGQPLIDAIIEQTHTCYLGDRTRRHDWGYGCGDCPACDLRRRGYEAFVESS